MTLRSGLTVVMFSLSLVMVLLSLLPRAENMLHVEGYCKCLLERWMLSCDVQFSTGCCRPPRAPCPGTPTTGWTPSTPGWTGESCLSCQQTSVMVSCWLPKLPEHGLDFILSPDHLLFRMSGRYPGTVKIMVIGQTHEGRDIKVARVGNRWPEPAAPQCNIPQQIKILQQRNFSVGSNNSWWLAGPGHGDGEHFIKRTRNSLDQFLVGWFLKSSLLGVTPICRVEICRTWASGIVNCCLWEPAPPLYHCLPGTDTGDSQGPSLPYL